ncbi:NAD-dependent epimerase/dehydratase family protein [Turicibacter sanguinis]|uniref:NAD-dependent epimerase/dehydratase family protein n=1 Tax=Turicibacter sanguinis TaxID=154288 RepID=UPI0018AACACB|nr:NAD-dependent epimerase/dehydratase family protein [Turicibacter sanguinis]MDB8553981.1 NAD-dependent epimerase/dehydratase family protein [Turicibacter sanguinis]
MILYDNYLYIEDIKYVANLDYNWSLIKDKTIMISGATGLIGSFLIDVLMYRNNNFQDNCKIIALGRDIKKAHSRYYKYWDSNFFEFLEQDIVNPITKIKDEIHFIFHAASNTHPKAYSKDPIGTMTTNIIGTYNLLEYAAKYNIEKFIFASTVEIYGENRGDIELFDENYCGYINCNTLRAGYPESKRAGEALCQAYIESKKVNIVIPRLARTYGPTMLASDSKAVSQFIKKGIRKENIILKSEGHQLYSYTYVADAVSAILLILFEGECGSAYNVADEKSDIMLKDLAKLIADYVETDVIYELPDQAEKKGYSTATQALMSGEKIKNIGWTAKYDIKAGIERTIEILSTINYV